MQNSPPSSKPRRQALHLNVPRGLPTQSSCSRTLMWWVCIRQEKPKVCFHFSFADNSCISTLAYSDRVLADKRMENTLESIQNESKMHRPGVAKDALNQLLANVGTETQSKMETLAARVASLEAPIANYRNVVSGLEVRCFYSTAFTFTTLHYRRLRTLQSRSSSNTSIGQLASATICLWQRPAFMTKLKFSPSTLFDCFILTIFVCKWSQHMNMDRPTGLIGLAFVTMLITMQTYIDMLELHSSYITLVLYPYNGVIKQTWH